MEEGTKRGTKEKNHQRGKNRNRSRRGLDGKSRRCEKATKRTPQRRESKSEIMSSTGAPIKTNSTTNEGKQAWSSSKGEEGKKQNEKKGHSRLGGRVGKNKKMP